MRSEKFRSLLESNGKNPLLLFSYGQALLAAQELRRQGTQAQLEVAGLGVEQALAYAGKQGIAQVLVAHSDGKRDNYRVE